MSFASLPHLWRGRDAEAEPTTTLLTHDILVLEGLHSRRVGWMKVASHHSRFAAFANTSTHLGIIHVVQSTRLPHATLRRHLRSLQRLHMRRRPSRQHLFGAEAASTRLTSDLANMRLARSGKSSRRPYAMLTTICQICARVKTNSCTASLRVPTVVVSRVVAGQPQASSFSKRAAVGRGTEAYPSFKSVAWSSMGSLGDTDLDEFGQTPLQAATLASTQTSDLNCSFSFSQHTLVPSKTCRTKFRHRHPARRLLLSMSMSALDSSSEVRPGLFFLFSAHLACNPEFIVTSRVPGTSSSRLIIAPSCNEQYYEYRRQAGRDAVARIWRWGSSGQES
uniref:Uncharacterized protein n=1 Tax=Mycena chlorophos TaxID=658473 RepID=A0ABQ0LU23_MYCCL|nr:predicted protein [Mycena chlorophos]